MGPPGDFSGPVSLFLDFDGTLVELADEPQGVRVNDRLPGLLERLSERLGGRLALVSGRSVADLGGFLPGLRIAFSGSHGAEIVGIDGHGPVERPESLTEIEEAFQRFASDAPGVLVETKPLGIALHYRGAPHAGEQALALAGELAEQHGLALKTGKMVVELLPHGFDKGGAVRALMALPPFAGSMPVFVGDDVTDEDGFAAAEALGGFGVLVGEARETRARHRFPDVDAVHDWLERLASTADNS